MTAIIEAVLGWLLQWILNYLLGKAIDASQTALEKMKQDQEKQVINDANTKAYEEAKTRQERIAAALLLLNRSHP